MAGEVLRMTFNAWHHMNLPVWPHKISHSNVEISKNLRCTHLQVSSSQKLSACRQDGHNSTWQRYCDRNLLSHSWRYSCGVSILRPLSPEESEVDWWLALPTCMGLTRDMTKAELNWLFPSSSYPAVVPHSWLVGYYSENVLFENNAQQRSLQKCFCRTTFGKPRFCDRAATCSCASMYNALSSCPKFLKYFSSKWYWERLDSRWQAHSLYSGLLPMLLSNSLFSFSTDASLLAESSVSATGF